MAIFLQLNFLQRLKRAGLSSIADGCVRKNVLNRLRFDNAGELDPNDSLSKRKLIKTFYFKINIHF